MNEASNEPALAAEETTGAQEEQGAESLSQNKKKASKKKASKKKVSKKKVSKKKATKKKASKKKASKKKASKKKASKKKASKKKASKKKASKKKASKKKAGRRKAAGEIERVLRAVDDLREAIYAFASEARMRDDLVESLRNQARGTIQSLEEAAGAGIQRVLRR